MTTTSKFRTALLVALAALGVLAAASGARAADVGYAFTYQGSLNDNGAAPTGAYDFRCTLWDADVAGTPIGPLLQLDDRPVSNGVFTLSLDFGSAAYTGSARWLQVELRQGGSTGAYTTLARQRLMPSPFAIGLSLPVTQRYPLVNAYAMSFTNPSGGAAQFVAGGTGANSVGVVAQNTGSGSAIYAVGNGATRSNATVRIENTQPAAGMCAYLTNSSTWATSHFQNDGSGEVLWLQKNAAGNFIVANNGSANVFWLDNAGTTHTKMLEVLGADLSERFDVHDPDGDLEPGTVVSIDPDHEGRLLVSTQAYDHRVAGIVSGAGGVRVGMLMGQDGTLASGKHPIALTGRVYCRATTRNGAIRPGDLLTTSDRPGTAMRVDDPTRATGAVLGKAMSALDSGDGLVLVLVGLR